MKNIIYLTKASQYNEILKSKHEKIPVFLKKIIYNYRNFFNITKVKEIYGFNICALPLKDKINEDKLRKMISKINYAKESIYVISNDFSNTKICKYMDEFNLKYLKTDRMKKILLIGILNYISNIQGIELNSMELTLLVNNISEINMYMIETLAKLVKSIKIVSSNIYKFKKIEDKLYGDYGIPIQFSNSYRKSLAKSKLIINFDFTILDINEYDIFNKAIIINCMEDNIKIKSKLFDGIIVNSCEIKIKEKTQKKLKQIGIYDKYNSLLLYESIMIKQNNYDTIEKENVTALIGNNGKINKKEFKNLVKILDKQYKKM